MMQVPRSGWTRIRKAGTPSSNIAGQMARHLRVSPAGHELVETREGKDDRGLHQLRRLEPDGAEIEPALGALADEAQGLDPDQHHQGDCVERKGDGFDRQFP